MSASSEPARERDIASLIALIEARSGKPFDWRGSRDCVAFASMAVKAQSGVDLLGDLRWRTRREARAFLWAEGGLLAAVDKRLSRVPVALALRGDIGAVAAGPRDVSSIRLMVIEGAMLVAPGKSGLERQPRANLLWAWDAMSALTGAGSNHG